MLGISEGTGTGKIVCQLLQNVKTEIGIDAFNPQRF
jgi:hypothetical protein